MIIRKQPSFHIGLWLCVLLIASASYAKASLIAVVKSRDIAPYNTAIEGFKKALDEEDIKFRLVEYAIAEDRELVKEIRSQSPDLILSIGSKATKIATKIKNIPIVFSMVLDPRGSSFVGLNITGVSLDIPPRSEFQLLKSIISGIKRIGVIYNPKETQSAINNARFAAKRLNLKLVTVRVNSWEEVYGAVRHIAERIDALWMIPDHTIYTPRSTHDILFYTLREGIPVVGLSPSYVKAGALFSLSCDYEDIGRQSGEIATRILRGESPSSIPIVGPQKSVLSLNLIVAERIGIEIPARVIRKAKNVYK